MFKTDDITYIHTFRTGGTFTRKSMEAIYPELKMVGHHFPLCKSNLKYKCIISTVRNPFDWYVSAYHFCIKENIDLGTGFSDFASFLKTMLSFKDSDKHKELIKQEWHSFAIVGATPTELKKYTKDTGFCSWVFNNMTCFREDVKFMRFENLTEDLIQMLKNNSTLTKEQEEQIKQETNSNITQRKPYKEYYTDELVSLVYEKDKIMFDKFNYVF
jgi:hypothetical protein